MVVFVYVREGRGQGYRVQVVVLADAVDGCRLDVGLGVAIRYEQRWVVLFVRKRLQRQVV